MSDPESIAVDELLRLTTAQLISSSPSPRLDAEILVGHLLGRSRLELIMDSKQQVSGEVRARLRELVDRRMAHEPIAYLTGEKEFFGLSFRVTPAVLVPRPETEILVEYALAFAREHSLPLRILDLGTGSGCIPVALAVNLALESRKVKLVAIEKSEEALAVARENALHHQVDNLIDFRQGDWLSALGDGEYFDVILSNPPYIARDDVRTSPELRHEPTGALYSGASGLDDIVRILGGIGELKVLPALILIETGFEQGTCLIERLRAADFGEALANASCEIIPDLAGLPRFLKVRPS